MTMEKLCSKDIITTGSDDGFTIWVDSQDNGTKSQPAASIRIAPLGNVHTDIHMRVNLCALSSLTTCVDGATFIDNPGDIEIYAACKETAQVLAQALSEAVQSIQAKHGVGTLDVREHKKTEPICKALEDIEQPQLGKVLVRKESHYEAGGEEQGFDICVSMPPKAKSFDPLFVISINSVGNAAEDLKLKIGMASPAFKVALENRSCIVDIPDSLQLSVSNMESAQSIATVLRAAAEAIEGECSRKRSERK